MAVVPVGLFCVRRPFDVDGKRVAPGDIVDVTEWRNAYQLLDRGYLVACPEDVAAPAVKSPVKKAATKRKPKPVIEEPAPES